jgi:hypothetical protein
LFELVHIGLETVAVVASLVLSFYCFRLISKFFKGGVFEEFIKILGASVFLFVGASVIHLILNLLEIQFAEIEMFQHILEITFVVAVAFGVRRLYQAWAKLGSR